MNLHALFFFSFSLSAHKTGIPRLKCYIKRAFPHSLLFSIVPSVGMFHSHYWFFLRSNRKLSPKNCLLLKSNQKHLSVFWNSKSIAHSYQLAFKSTSYGCMWSMRSATYLCDKALPSIRSIFARFSVFGEHQFRSTDLIFRQVVVI